MKIKHSIALILAVVTVSVSLTYWYVKTHMPTGKPYTAVETHSALSALIATSRPEVRAFTLRIPWIGAVEARTSISLSAPAAGSVEAFEVQDQARIEKGGLVVRLGGIRIKGLRARFKAEVESLKSQLELSRQETERLKQNLKAQLSTKNQVAAAQDEQVKIETRLHEARLKLETFENRLRILAPIDGIFTNRRVSAGQNVTAGQIIAEIIDADHLRIAASLFPPRWTELLNKKARIRLDHNQHLIGFVRYILPRAGSTGAVKVWIEGPQIDRQLRPGQTVAGSLDVKVTPGTLAVPASAIVYDAKERSYLFVRKGSDYEVRQVRLGMVQNGWVEVLSGLEKGQLVVTRGAYQLFYRRFYKQFKVQD
jgi:RND family efflux transporter MFP subunit